MWKEVQLPFSCVSILFLRETCLVSIPHFLLFFFFTALPWFPGQDYQTRKEGDRKGKSADGFSRIASRITSFFFLFSLPSSRPIKVCPALRRKWESDHNILSSSLFDTTSKGSFQRKTVQWVKERRRRRRREQNFRVSWKKRTNGCHSLQETEGEERLKTEPLTENSFERDLKSVSVTQRSPQILNEGRRKKAQSTHKKESSFALKT